MMTYLKRERKDLLSHLKEISKDATDQVKVHTNICFKIS